jgi:hypothetical protein
MLIVDYQLGAKRTLRGNSWLWTGKKNALANTTPTRAPMTGTMIFDHKPPLAL